MTRTREFLELALENEQETMSRQSLLRELWKLNRIEPESQDDRSRPKTGNSRN